MNKAVAVAKADLAEHRLPWIGFKLPYGWADMAAGKGDAWTVDLAPEARQAERPRLARLPPRARGRRRHQAVDGDAGPPRPDRPRRPPPNVAYSIVVTGWNQFFGAEQYSLDTLWPRTRRSTCSVSTSTKVRRRQERQGADHAHRPGRVTTSADRRLGPEKGLPWGVAETGYSDQAAGGRPAVGRRARTMQLKSYGGVAFTYFNTKLNSVATWAIDHRPRSSRSSPQP